MSTARMGYAKKLPQQFLDISLKLQGAGGEEMSFKLLLIW